MQVVFWRTGVLQPPMSSLTEPVVRVTLRISTTVSLAPKVQVELQECVQNNTTGLAAMLHTKGHDVSAIYIDSITSSLVRRSAPPFMLL